MKRQSEIHYFLNLPDTLGVQYLHKVDISDQLEFYFVSEFERKSSVSKFASFRGRVTAPLTGLA